jgi:UDP-N-acetylmuramate dehydrogenase
MNDYIQNEPLKKHTTLAIGGPARLFVEAESQEELTAIVKKAIADKTNFLVLGAGSNLLVSDAGYDGLIIKNKVAGISLSEGVLTVKAGTPLQELVDFSVENSLSGMQKMTGIPGTVGGAIYGNAGAYGQTISDCLVRVKVFDGEKTFWIQKNDCKFSYRDSDFKNNKLILLEAEFKLAGGDENHLKKEKEETLSLRLKKYKPGLACPGSFFKNIQINDLSPEQLSAIPQEKIVYGKIPAGYLLEEVGAKGAEKGEIIIADFHANLFINKGNGTAEDFSSLAEEYKQKVKQKFGIELEPEVQLIGFD